MSINSKQKLAGESLRPLKIYFKQFNIFKVTWEKAATKFVEDQKKIENDKKATMTIINELKSSMGFLDGQIYAAMKMVFFIF